MEAKITKKLVDQVQPGDREIMVFDSVLKGFVLRVSPGGTKTYAVRYRMGGRDTPLRTLKIGKHGSPWTPDQARTEAEKLLGQVSQGTDPAAERKAREVRGMTVNDLADRYLLQHVEVRNKPRTAAGVRWMLEKHIKPALGRLAVTDVTRAHIVKFHHDRKGTPRQANLLVSVLAKMFSLAEAWGVRPDSTNPCRLVERYRENARERFLSSAEVEKLGPVLSEMEESGAVGESSANVVRLLLLTGCRRDEVRLLRWEDVDLEIGALHIRDAKAGGRVHPIGAVAMAFMAELPRYSEWVFSAVRNRKIPLPVGTLEGSWKAVREKAGISDVRLHDLRHTHGTYAGSTNANAFLVRDKLGQKTLAMTGRYVNKETDPLRELSDKVEARFTALLKLGSEARLDEAADKVVPITKGRKRS
jgi:integrase